MKCTIEDISKNYPHIKKKEVPGFLIRHRVSWKTNGMKVLYDIDESVQKALDMYPFDPDEPGDIDKLLNMMRSDLEILGEQAVSQPAVPQPAIPQPEPAQVLPKKKKAHKTKQDSKPTKRTAVTAPELPMYVHYQRLYGDEMSHVGALNLVNRVVSETIGEAAIFMQNKNKDLERILGEAFDIQESYYSRDILLEKLFSYLTVLCDDEQETDGYDFSEQTLMDRYLTAKEIANICRIPVSEAENACKKRINKITKKSVWGIMQKGLSGAHEKYREDAYLVDQNLTVLFFLRRASAGPKKQGKSTEQEVPGTADSLRDSESASELNVTSGHVIKTNHNRQDELDAIEAYVSQPAYDIPDHIQRRRKWESVVDYLFKDLGTKITQIRVRKTLQKYDKIPDDKKWEFEFSRHYTKLRIQYTLFDMGIKEVNEKQANAIIKGSYIQKGNKDFFSLYEEHHGGMFPDSKATITISNLVDAMEWYCSIKHTTLSNRLGVKAYEHIKKNLNIK
ncbi:hypothetical protein ACFL96_14310 [Thermoproteota archaeon]